MADPITASAAAASTPTTSGPGSQQPKTGPQIAENTPAPSFVSSSTPPEYSGPTPSVDSISISPRAQFEDMFTNRSLSDLFRNVLTTPEPKEDQKRLLKSMNDSLDALRNIDPKLAKRLDALLKTLSKMNKGMRGVDRFMQQLDLTLRRLASVVSKVSAPAEGLPTEGAPAVEGLNAPPSTQNTATTFSFVLDIEITQSTSIEATMAELTEQGVSVSRVRIEESSSFRLRLEVTATTGDGQPQQAEPLILDLDGDGVHATTVEDGVTFDIDGDGTADKTAFVREGDGALALDRNGNGLIDSGKELFGDQHGAANGYEELAKFDDNADGQIDAHDSVYASLGVLRDANADGQLDPSEFMSLDRIGIESISLVNELLREDDGKGNTFAERGAFTWSDGSAGKAVDLWFAYQPGKDIVY